MGRPKKQKYRTLFAETLVTLEGIHEQLTGLDGNHPLYAKFAKELEEAIEEKLGVPTSLRTTSKRMPWDTERAKRLLGPEAYEEIREPFAKESSEIAAKFKRQLKRVNDRLNKLAPLALIKPGDKWLVIDSVNSLNYRTQPAAINYARQRARIQAESLEGHAEVQVSTISESYGTTFLVRAKVAQDLDAEILRRIPGPSMSLFIQKCEAYGVNPRVYYPGLIPESE